MRRAVRVIPVAGSSPPAPITDLLLWPLVGPVLRWRHLRTTLRLALLLVAVIVVAHGLAGPDLAPKNLAALLSWIHYRGLLIGALLVAGNAFCSACPMILVRDLGRRLHAPVRSWPRWLGAKRVAIALVVLILFAYERYDLWALPAATAWLVIGYFAAALAVDLTFRGAAFCKHVCPVGQFSFVVSTLSPLELRARDTRVCRDCVTADCIRGRRDAGTGAITQRGCELGLFLPTKVGNLDCTFCLDCVQACPHDNVALAPRVPGEELADDHRRSSIGRLSRRSDLAVLSMVLTAGALVNAFAMTAPAYALQAWLADALGTRSETVLLAVLFMAALGVVPVAVAAIAAAATRALTGSPLTVRDIAVRYAFALVPVGVGIWLAHYGFHFLTGAGTIVPVVQGAIADAFGQAWLGEPDWRWIGLRPGLVFPLEVGAALLGGAGGLVLVRAISERDHAGQATRASMPWNLVVAAIAMLAIWVLTQPMEMRGTALG